LAKLIIINEILFYLVQLSLKVNGYDNNHNHKNCFQTNKR